MKATSEPAVTTDYPVAFIWCPRCNCREPRINFALIESGKLMQDLDLEFVVERLRGI